MRGFDAFSEDEKPRGKVRVLEFLSRLFDTNGFPPRWHCGAWSDPHGWLHVGSDTAVFLAYIAIPALLAFVLRSRKDVPRPLPRILFLFIGFILACGLTHLNEAIIFWHPFYRWAGVVKLTTAVVSWATVIALVPALPAALAMRTPESLRQEVELKTQALRENNEALERELTARQRAETAFAEAEAKYHRLYDTAPDIYVSVNAKTGKILECNQIAIEKLGYSREELVGTDILELYTKDCRTDAAAALETSVVSNVELAVLTQAGKRLAISLSVTALKNSEGKVVETRSALHDITDKKNAGALFALAVEASPSAMIATDAQGAIVLINAEGERLFGYPREEILGASVERLMPATHRKKHPALRVQFASNPEARKMGANRSLTALRKNGVTFPIEVGLNPIEGPQGPIVLAAILDRTEAEQQRQALQKQSAELKRSNEELESFAYAVSHDLRAPLRGLQNAATWIEEDLPTGLLSDDLQENLKLMMNRAQRMETLLSALLDYARAGRAESAVAVLDIAQMLDDVFELMAPPPEAVLVLPKNLPSFETARPPLEQVFTNLLSNALKHGDQVAPRIEIAFAEELTQYSFTVSDNGPGIAPAQHQKIFEVFQTLKPRDELESTGIGLALVKKVVESHGGSVWVESKLGHGATFKFTWPKQLNPAPPNSERPA